MPMQNSHTLIRATCWRIRIARSAGRDTVWSSVEIFPYHEPKARGSRAECTLSGVRTVPKRLRVRAYTSFISSPRGRSMGGIGVHHVLLFGVVVFGALTQCRASSRAWDMSRAHHPC